jgi:hypothetical protein
VPPDRRQRSWYHLCNTLATLAQNLQRGSNHRQTLDKLKWKDSLQDD